MSWKAIKKIAIVVLCVVSFVLLIWGIMAINSYDSKLDNENCIAFTMICISVIFTITLFGFCILIGVSEHIRLLSEIEKHMCPEKMIGDEDGAQKVKNQIDEL